MKTKSVCPQSYNTAPAYEKSSATVRTMDQKFSRLPRKSLADEVSHKKKSIPAPNAYKVSDSFQYKPMRKY